MASPLEIKLLWNTRQLLWMAQVISWKLHTANSGWWGLFFLFNCIIRCTSRLSSWSCAVFVIHQWYHYQHQWYHYTNINSQLRLFAEDCLIYIPNFNLTCWPSNPPGWFRHFDCMHGPGHDKWNLMSPKCKILQVSTHCTKSLYSVLPDVWHSFRNCWATQLPRSVSTSKNVMATPDCISNKAIPLRVLAQKSLALS